MITTRKSLIVLTFIWLVGPIESAEAKIALTCKGKPVGVSLELHYRWDGGGGLGTVRVPELTIRRDLENCRLEDLYQALVTVSGIVVRHSTGARVNTAMIQLGGKAEWHRVSDFSAVILSDGMRIWMTLFNSPNNKPPLKKAWRSGSQHRATIRNRASLTAQLLLGDEYKRNARCKELVRFHPKSGHHRRDGRCPLMTQSGH